MYNENDDESWISFPIHTQVHIASKLLNHLHTPTASNIPIKTHPPRTSGRVFRGDSSTYGDNSWSMGNYRELAYTQRMERMDECKVIRIPRRIKLNKNAHLKLTARQILMIRQFLRDNNVNLSQLLTTLATDKKQSVDVFLARAYNATISEQQRIIISQRRDKTFTFCNIEGRCGKACRFQILLENEPGIRHFIGCVSHDVVKTLLDEDPNAGYPRLLGESRALLNYGPLPAWKKHHGWDDCVQYVKDEVHDRMDEAVGMLDEWIACIPSRQPHQHYDEKFRALDVQYKIIHCLLTQPNPFKQAIKATRWMWEDLEACFMEVFERFDKDDLHRLATEDDGIWCAMFDLVCHWANKEHILPKLSEARQTIGRVIVVERGDLRDMDGSRG